MLNYQLLLTRLMVCHPQSQLGRDNQQRKFESGALLTPSHPVCRPQSQLGRDNQQRKFESEMAQLVRQYDSDLDSL